eukprot:3584976-Amphidinium_carterae.1
MLDRTTDIRLSTWQVRVHPLTNSLSPFLRKAMMHPQPKFMGEKGINLSLSRRGEMGLSELIVTKTSLNFA